MSRIKEILIRRDGISEEEAQELIDIAKEDLDTILDSEHPSLWDAEQVVYDLGLEPDYLEELLYE